jgi:Fe-S-cluster containining protein
MVRRFFCPGRNEHPEFLSCHKGCCEWCGLTSVSEIEAYVIRDFIAREGLSMNPAMTPGACVFLADGACGIYPARPVICRTQGLVLTQDNDGPVSSCPKCFAGMKASAVPAHYILDVAKIAGNLMRLNLAFCMAKGMAEKAGRRIQLREICKNAGSRIC